MVLRLDGKLIDATPIRESFEPYVEMSEFRPWKTSRRAVSSNAKKLSKTIQDIVLRNEFIQKSNQNVGFLNRHFGDIMDHICTFSYNEITQMSNQLCMNQVESILENAIYVYNKRLDGFIYSVTVAERRLYERILNQEIFDYIKSQEGQETINILFIPESEIKEKI